MENIQNLNVELIELKELYTFYNLRYKNILYEIQTKKGNANYYFWLGYYHYKLLKVKDKLRLCENVELN